MQQRPSLPVPWLSVALLSASALAYEILLTRWFAVEYATTFGLVLPGLQAMGLVIPLGGTSNHFRPRALRDLGGWDPFNVTEDCDLGVRIPGSRLERRVRAVEHELDAAGIAVPDSAADTTKENRP